MSAFHFGRDLDLIAAGGTLIPCAHRRRNYAAALARTAVELLILAAGLAVLVLAWAAAAP